MKNDIKNILIYDISYKTLIDPKPLRIIDSVKQMDLLKFLMKLDIQRFLALKNMLFMTELDILEV